MNTPDAQLMRLYDTEQVFLEKTAGAESFVGPLSMAVLNYQWGRNKVMKERERRQEAAMMQEMARQAQHQRMAEAEQALEFTPPPYSSMVRLASIASDIGRDMAKEAGIGDFMSGIGKAIAGSGAAAGVASKAGGFLQRAGLTAGALKWKLPVAGAALAAGYGAMKAGKGALNYMSQEGHPQQWGTAGPQLANGVNQYGQPQVGSSFQG